MDERLDHRSFFEFCRPCPDRLRTHCVECSWAVVPAWICPRCRTICDECWRWAECHAKLLVIITNNSNSEFRSSIRRTDIDAASTRRQQEIAGAGDCRTGGHHECVFAGSERGGENAGATESHADYHIRVVGVVVKRINHIFMNLHELSSYLGAIFRQTYLFVELQHSICVEHLNCGECKLSDK